VTQPTAWRRSRFTFVAPAATKEMVLYNSLTGALARIPAAADGFVETLAALASGIDGPPRGALAELALNGFFVPEHADEEAEVDALCREERRAEEDRLELILMPTERCNFRCVYCAQSFAKGRMTRDVVDKVIALIRRRAPSLRTLRIGWFGGEPLVAAEVIAEIGAAARRICAEHGIVYSSGIASNAYLLTADVFAMLIENEVRSFQITLDGAPRHHDRLRVLGDGRRGTFATILAHLRAMKASPEVFRVTLRVNFDARSAKDMGELLDILEAEFAGDERFGVDFHPVGRWGGPHDHTLAVCDAQEGSRLSFEHAGAAAARGVAASGLTGRLRPGGSKCYAARPYAFVIGSDGALYKCTVAFDEPMNQIGMLGAHGELHIDEAKHERWIGQGADADAGCRSCSFAPACQGNACPLARMRTGQRACPSVKTHVGTALAALQPERTG
jgi:uncharacterized protein